MGKITLENHLSFLAPKRAMCFVFYNLNHLPRFKNQEISTKIQISSVKKIFNLATPLPAFLCSSCVLALRNSCLLTWDYAHWFDTIPILQASLPYISCWAL